MHCGAGYLTTGRGEVLREWRADRKVGNSGQRPVLGFRFGGRLGPKLQCSLLCENVSCEWLSRVAVFNS